jgi:FdhD protein
VSASLYPDAGTSYPRAMASTPDRLRRSITRRRVVTVQGGVRSERPDSLATEEPMEIRAEGAGRDAVPVAVTMRTPGGDFELAVGFLFTEGLIDGRGDVRRVSYCEDLPADEQHYNVVTVSLTRAFELVAARRFAISSSCGICGKSSLDQVEVRCEPIAPGPVVKAEVVARLPRALREAQPVFDRTGGLHAAGLFAPDGTLLSLREDVGRHNAVDKVVGEAVLAGDLPLAERLLQVSGRVSFEIVQKAARAGIPLVSAVSAPSSLAVEAAQHLGMTLVGFARDGRFNIYANPERIAV